MRHLIKKVLPFLVISFIVIYFYRRVFNGFFQQDEWFSYGYFVLNKNLNLGSFVKFILAPNVTHYNPLTVFVEYVLFSLWGMNYTNFAVLGIISHLALVFSVFLLSLKIFKNNRLLSFFSALLFGVFASTYQGTAWIVVDIATIWASILGVLSTYLFLEFLDKRKRKDFVLSIVFLLISLFIKEITLGLFPFFVVLWFLNVKRKKMDVKYLIAIFSVGFIYFIFRLLMILLSHGTGGGLATDSEPLKDLIYNFVSIPFKSLTQIIVPPDFIHFISESIARILPLKLTGPFGSPEFETFVVKRVMELISWIIAVLVLVPSFLFVHKNKYMKNGYIMIFSLGWVIINSFIISLSPGRTGLISAIDSRNLYFLSVGVAVFLIFVINELSKSNNRRFLVIFILLLIFNTYFLSVSLNNFVQMGEIRKQILNQLTTENSKLPNKVVFYIESDTSYYGLPERTHIMPFQSGFGQTILAWYEKSNNFPNNFFANNYLWDIDSQGYREINGIGFGYFRNFYDYAKFSQGFRGSNPTLIAYSFDSKSNTLKNMTDELLGRIEGYEAKKTLLNPNSFSVNVSQNSSDIMNIFDGNIKTAWSSKLAYMNYQYLVIDMKRGFDIAEVTIQSYNDQNQNGVGYRIQLSNDNKVWKTVFESKSYPPDSNGVDNLYFKPMNTRFVKIEQIGFHKYAPWVINELSIYAKN